VISLRGGTLVELSGRAEAGSVTLGDDGRLGGPDTGAQVIDCTGCVVMPGLVCGHTHLYSALARGMPGSGPAPTNFVEILERVWWKLDRVLDGPMITASALAGARDALLAGTTTLIDHHASPGCIDGSLDLIADACQELGLRAATCYEVTDRHGKPDARRGVVENDRFLRENRRPLVRGLVGAHASFTMGDDTLAACGEVARAHGVGVHIHVSEDAADLQDALRRGAPGVVARLAAAQVLDRRALLAHGVHLTGVEREQVAASGPWVAHNARSNMNNSVGYARPLTLGGRVVLGTDGIDSDMFEETRAAYFRSREHDVRTFAEETVARLAAGAALAGELWNLPLGRLEDGAAADVIVLDYDPPTPIHAGNVAWHLVFGMRALHVRDVFVAGRPVVRDRRLVTADARQLSAAARDQARRLWSVL
jgi:putative selenium metabolism protein SsnA